MKPFRNILLSLGVLCAASVVCAHCSHGAQKIPVRRGEIIESVYGIGTVTARHTFQLKLANPATIAQVYTREGDHVAIGAQLLSLTDGRAFTSPIAGTVTTLPFHASENVFAQSLIVSVVDLSDRYLLVSLEQIGAMRSAPGQIVHASFESMRDTKITGTVRAIYPSDNQFLVDITPSELPAQILPGMTADVAIEIAHPANALLVPIRAIHDGTITRQRNNQRATIPIKTGATTNTESELLTGDVQEGDLIIVE